MVRLQIKELAQAQGLKQYQLQERSGVTAQLLSRYWNNHTRSVSLEQIAKIAKALGVRPGDLIVPDEEEAQPRKKEKRVA